MFSTSSSGDAADAAAANGSNEASSSARGAGSDGSSSEEESGVTLARALGRGSVTLGGGAASAVAAAAAAAEGAGPGPQSSPQGSKRFYETVTVEPAPGQPGWWAVMLGKYPVRTPARNAVVLPSLPLALALAAEWEWLPTGKPILHVMPLMSLVATAIDQPKPRGRVTEDLLKYAHTDAACVRYEPGPLARRQAAAFDPLLAWAAEEMGWKLHASDNIAGPTQDEATIAAVRAWLEGLDGWRLAAAEQLTAACKSVLLAAALLRGRVGPAEALAAARLEEDYQIEDWGVVEAGHDLDVADLRTRVGAPALMAALLARGGGGGAAAGTEARGGGGGGGAGAGAL
ncbi:MAG: hypothetical protein J3K34DRAFT_474312 [Monoraphidium minutum]|nr:MAG: hypothetical protein J3K34DRAFT_474312 [Monoraphidium minutum]